MSAASDRARHAWPLRDQVTLGERLVAAYEQPWRHYHDVQHLAEVLDRIDEICTASPDLRIDRPAIVLAAYFHDVVYDVAVPWTARASNEELSAQRAEVWLTSAGVAWSVVAEVARLVRGTATHASTAGDVNAAVLFDADLAILASGLERYDAYVQDVRAEYAAVPDDAFATGRAAVLQALLDQPSLFTTAYAQEHWEAEARANVTRELSDA
ncbi:HD domain-containing protein [Luteipulveratus mongoliensis]|uniref:Metal-dependent phosphohydrolase n=1 Tax=Luteipulveratus mongoliensis TaxID=571913 RepID=A0A0K1JL09_9MICO|nr:hypothetical protein [Luteipulveratus mongoliensis]AKU17250.1 hypothetical protein VV02_17660 [Luteipulveratus mongoliensis]